MNRNPDWDAYKPLIGLNPRAPLFCPTGPELDEVEARAGRRFPRSYRDFALAFGRGDFVVGDPDLVLYEYVIAVPGQPSAFPRCDPPAMTRWKRDINGPDADASYAEMYHNGALASRLILFCWKKDRGFFGWDPDEVTDESSSDYAVYLIEDKDPEIKRVASGFADFLRDVVFEGKLDPANPEPVLRPSPEGEEDEEDEEEAPDPDDYYVVFSPDQG